jgi:septal ring factor EnvC (AmiA/AmiB activator)
LYDEDSEGEKPMDMETTDLPTERDDFSVPPAAAMGGADSDVSQLVQELASRIANLETRLDEANDSRERLERQVAAQSEELRVQRAAIARTQRALRSLSRSEEDQATEPALREPSQPAK